MAKKQNADIKIEPLKTSDIKTIYQIGRNIPEFSVGTDTPSFYSKNTLRRMATSKNCIALTAKKDGKIAGFMITSIIPAARDAYMHTIAVIKEYRHQGVASKLVEKTLGILEQRPNDVNHVFGDIQIENKPSLSLFKKKGFQIGRPFHYIDMLVPRKQLLP